MPRPQIVIDVTERGFGERAQRLPRHHQHVLAQHLLDPDALARDLLVGRGIRAKREQGRVLVGRNGLLLVGKGGRGVHGVLFGLHVGSKGRCQPRGRPAM